MRTGVIDRLKECAYLCAIVDSHLNQPGLLVIQNAVMGKLPVSIVIELHTSCQAIWVLG